MLAVAVSSASQRAIGPSGIGGMLGAMVLPVFLVPIFLVVVHKILPRSARQVAHGHLETHNVNRNAPPEDR